MEIESRTYRSHVHSVMCKAVAVHMEHVRVAAKGTDVPDGRVIHAHFKWRIIRIDQPVQRRKGRRLSGVELAGRSEVDELGMPGRIVVIALAEGRGWAGERTWARCFGPGKQLEIRLREE
jgi:hypothetical protein